jgi:N6-adenosine-specific RNA methylase IME4
MSYPHHPLADIFPLIEGEEFHALVASIRLCGQRDPIMLYGALVLDGRNRQRACIAAGVTPRYEDFTGADPLAFVIDKNLRRRHLDESQRAFCAAKLANLDHGGARKSEDEQAANLPLETEIPTVSQADAARLMNVSERSVRSAKAVQERGTPELQDAVQRGVLPVSVAVNVAKLEPEKQRAIADQATRGDTSGAKAQVKKDVRDQKEKVLAGVQRALPQKKYGLIYADIPRHFNVHSDETGLDRAPENHYPTMSFEETLALPVPSIAADDCILIFWSTAASLIDDLDIMAEWGFVTFRPRITNGKLVRKADGKLADPIKDGGRYCSMQVWDKVKMGLGYWFRDRHEFILVAARGNVVPPAQGTQDQSLFSEEKGKHSAKPDRVAEMINRLWPNIPKIELFARKARAGWDVWGYEAPQIAGADPQTVIPDEMHEIPQPPAGGNIGAASHSEPVPVTGMPSVSPAGAGSLSVGDDGLDIPKFLLRKKSTEQAA